MCFVSCQGVLDKGHFNSDLRMAILPVAFEIFGIALYAYCVPWPRWSCEHILIHNMWAPYFHKKQVESHPFFPRFPVTCWDIDGWNQVSHCRHPKSTHLGNQVMQHSRVEGLMLGSVLAALGDGLVIPKMQAAAGWGMALVATHGSKLELQFAHQKKVHPPPTKHRGGHC